MHQIHIIYYEYISYIEWSLAELKCIEVYCFPNALFSAVFSSHVSHVESEDVRLWAVGNVFSLSIQPWTLMFESRHFFENR